MVAKGSKWIVNIKRFSLNSRRLLCEYALHLSTHNDSLIDGRCRFITTECKLHKVFNYTVINREPRAIEAFLPLFHTAPRVYLHACIHLIMLSALCSINTRERWRRLWRQQPAYTRTCLRTFLLLGLFRSWKYISNVLFNGNAPKFICSKYIVSKNLLSIIVILNKLHETLSFYKWLSIFCKQSNNSFILGTQLVI